MLLESRVSGGLPALEVFVKKYVSLVNSTNLPSLVCILNRYYHIAHIGLEY